MKVRRCKSYALVFNFDEADDAPMYYTMLNQLSEVLGLTAGVRHCFVDDQYADVVGEAFNVQDDDEDRYCGETKEEKK